MNSTFQRSAAWLGLFLSAATATCAGADAAPLASLTFEKDIRPILKANCFDCHGEGDKLKGNLDLRLRRLMVRGGESGPAIQPGNPSGSLLVQKIRAGEMPKRDKKLSQDEIALIEHWISQGAKTARTEPQEVAGGVLITDEERSFWSFLPVRLPAIPRPPPGSRVRTPIDAFIFDALSKKGLSFSPDADKVTLLRRVYFDLIGLPPPPAEIAEFLSDLSADAYERLIDRLLASPQYGERWGRHWLDAAGYADSDGYTDADAIRNYSYKFRDYVIRSFNADKPFDEFIQEQLAGDEMAGFAQTNLESIIGDPQSVEKLIATGFLRMGPDGTGSGSADQDLARNQVMAETIKIVSTSLMGLSVGCAQCHDHRYDPIPQSDYYRLRAIFEPAYDWKHWRNPNQRLISLYTDADRAQAAKVESEAQQLAAEKEAKQKQYIDEALEKHLEKFPEAQREPLRTAFHTPKDKRTAEQRKLLDENPSVNISAGVLYQYNPKAADELKAMDGKIAAIRARKPVEDFVAALTEMPGQIPVTYVFHRGDHQQPKNPVMPGGLSVLSPPGRGFDIANDDPALATTGRRLAFARWLTNGRHPLLARVLVNRIWMHHFGRGLVGTPSDFGAMGEKPTHPELLDWLASVFVAQPSSAVAHPGLGWSSKRLHKMILLSTVYRQSSRRDPEKETIDPDNVWYWRKPVERLDAEVIRDSILAASGALNPKMFGPPVPVKEDAVGQIVVGVDQKGPSNTPGKDVPLGAEEFRRSLYIQVRRSRPLAFLNAFDAPVMETNCDRRRNSTVATQALMLMNSDFILAEARRFAERLRRDADGDTRREIALAWQLAFGRGAGQKEIRQAQEFLDRQAASLAAQPPPSEKPSAKTGSGKQETTAPALQALTDFCQALLSSNEFLYVD